MPAKKAITKTKNTAMSVSDVQARIAEKAAQASETVGRTSGNTIKIDQRGEMFTIPGLGDAPSPMDLVIVDYISQNSFYTGPYRPDDPQPPACFAIGKIIGDMVPSPNSPEPQADSCSACPMNEFGSADNGIGKACKNTRTLAVLPPESAPDEELMRLNVSPSGLKSFDGYVQKLAVRESTIPVAKVTEISIVPTKNQGYTVAFGNPRDNENLGADFERCDEAEAMLSQEPDVGNYEAVQKPAPRRRAPARRKTTAKKKVAAKRR